jgi:hypothetical protein
LAAAAFGDAGQQQGQPADQDVGADAVFQAVEHRTQQQGGLEVAEATFGLEEVLVSEGGVFGADVRVAGGDEVLAVQPGLGLDLCGVHLQSAVGLLGQPAAERGVVAQCAFGAHVRGFVACPGLVTVGTLGIAGALLGDTGQLGLDTGDRVVALQLVAFGLFWVVADDEPHILLVEADLLDA